jgi:hypothetical protein
MEVKTKTYLRPWSCHCAGHVARVKNSIVQSGRVAIHVELCAELPAETAVEHHHAAKAEPQAVDA